MSPNHKSCKNRGKGRQGHKDGKMSADWMTDRDLLSVSKSVSLQVPYSSIRRYHVM